MRRSCLRALTMSILAVPWGVLALPSRADDIGWINSGIGAFGISSNWSPTQVPGTADTADFELGGSQQVNFSEDESTQVLRLYNDNVGMDLGGHVYTLTETQFDGIYVLSVAGSSAQLTLQNGQLAGSGVTLGTFANEPGGSSTLVVDANAWLNITGIYPKIAVGDGGDSTLTVQHGGHVTLANASGLGLWVGCDPSTGLAANGTVNIFGLGSILDSSSDPTIIGAYGGSATLNIKDGALMLGSYCYVGYGNFGAAGISHGTVSVLGPDSLWKTGPLYVGFGAGTVGSMTIAEGGMVQSSSSSAIGEFAGSAGTVEMGASTWVVSGSLVVAGQGQGGLAVNIGAELQTADAQIAYSPGSSGSVSLFGPNPNELTGPGGKWTLGGILYVGGSSNGAGGTGSLTMQGEAVLNATAGIILWDKATITATQLASISTSLLAIAQSGTASVSLSTGSSITLVSSNGNNHIYIGLTNGSGGALTVDGMGTIISSSSPQSGISVGGGFGNDTTAQGTLNVTGGAHIAVDDILIADGVSAANHSTGAVLVSGPGTSIKSHFIGVGGGANAQASFNSATLHITNAAVVTSEIAVGPNNNQASGAATLTIDDGGELVDDPATQFGHLVTAGTGTSTLIASGFPNNSGGYTPTILGALSVHSFATGTASATLNQGAQLSNPDPNSGLGLTLDVDGASAESGRASITITDPKTLVQGGSRAEIYAGLLTISNGAELMTAKGNSPTGSAGIIGADGGTTAKVVVTGAESLWDCTDGHLTIGYGNETPLQVSGALEIRAGGTVKSINGYLGRFNQATGTSLITDPGSIWQLSGSLYIGGNESTVSGSSGTVTLVNGGQLSVNGEMMIWSAGTFDVSGGKALVGGGPPPGTQGTVRIGAGGTLLDDGTLLGNVLLENGTLGGYGTITGDVVAGVNAHVLAPSASMPPSSAGTLRLGTLSTNSLTTLRLNLISPGASSINDAIDVTAVNGLTLNAATVQIINTATGPASLGYYRIIGYSGVIQGSGVGSLTLPADDAMTHVAYRLYTNVDPGFIDLHRGLLGDANDDGVVNFADFVRLSNHFGASDGGWGGADFNNDGVTNFADFVALSNNFGATIGAGQAAQAGGAASSVPEPASLILLGAGLARVFGSRRPTKPLL